MVNKEIVFGDKSTFAIRYIRQHKAHGENHTWYYGYLHLVLSGQLIGYPDETCSVEGWLSSISGIMSRIEEGKYNNELFCNKRDDEMFELVWKANQFEEEFKPEYAHLPQPPHDVWYCHLHIDETTDSWLITMHDDGANLKFLWKDCSRLCPPQLKDKLFTLSVRKEDVLRTIDQCVRYVSQDLENYTVNTSPPPYQDRTPKGENFTELIESNKDKWSQLTFKKIACAFARLGWEKLDEAGREALSVAELFWDGELSSEIRDFHHKKLQDMLPAQGYSPYSPVLWALTEPTSGYPAWHNALLAGMNVSDLGTGNNDDLCAIINEYAEK